MDCLMLFAGGDAYIAPPFAEERLYIARADVGIGPYGRAEEPAAGRKSFGRKVVRLFASLNLYLHP